MDKQVIPIALYRTLFFSDYWKSKNNSQKPFEAKISKNAETFCISWTFFFCFIYQAKKMSHASQLHQWADSYASSVDSLAFMASKYSCNPMWYTHAQIFHSIIHAFVYLFIYLKSHTKKNRQKNPRKKLNSIQIFIIHSYQILNCVYVPPLQVYVCTTVHPYYT